MALVDDQEIPRQSAATSERGRRRGNCSRTSGLAQVVYEATMRLNETPGLLHAKASAQVDPCSGRSTTSNGAELVP